jgi:hypothetical protein
LRRRHPFALVVLSISLLTAIAPFQASALQIKPVKSLLDSIAGCDPIDPTVCLLPFPNDYFTVRDDTTATGRRVALSPLAMPRNVAGVPIDPTDYNRNDGFSPGSLIVTRVPGLDTPAALAATNPVGLTDLGRYADADAPVVVIDAASGARHPVWVEIDRSEDLNGNPPPPDKTVLMIHPSVNFAEGHRYIVALRFLKNTSGQTLHARKAFAAFANGTGEEKRQRHFDRQVFPQLAAAGIARSDLYLAWDFTVASQKNLSRRMLHIRDAAFKELGDTNLADLTIQGASPKFVVDSITQSLPCQPEIDIDIPPVSCNQGSLDARLARRVQGRILVPCFLNLPGCPPGSKFLYNGTGATALPIRIPGNVQAASFVCNIPKGALTGKTYRPSLYGHGLLGSADEVNSGKLYDLGGDPYGLMFCATDWSGMSSEDLANDVALLAELGRFSTLADRGQQGMLNFMFLGRAMIHPSGFCADAAFQIGGHCVIDTSRLYYNGGSQGGIMGGSLTAVAPDFTRAHLGVPGMNYSTLLQRSTDFDTYALILYRAYPRQIDRQLILSLIQMLWDRAESDGYAHHMTTHPYKNTPAHEVLMTPAFGDHQVTNWATDVMMRTVGVSIRTPEVDPGRHPAGANAYWGIPTIGSYPFAGSAAVIGEIGPLRVEGGRTKGTTPPPLINIPNTAGVDPHGPDWSETPDGYLAISSFLSPLGMLVAVCGDHPCWLDGWTSP